MDEPKTSTVSARIPESLFRQLEQARHLENRTMSNLIYVLLKEAIRVHLIDEQETTDAHDLQ